MTRKTRVCLCKENNKTHLITGLGTGVNRKKGVDIHFKSLYYSGGDRKRSPKAQEGRGEEPANRDGGGVIGASERRGLRPM